MSRTVLLCALINLFSLEARAQVIGGIIVDRDQQPVDNAHITVEGTNIIAVSDQNGTFELISPNETSQSLTLIITKVGFKPSKQELKPDDLDGSDLTIMLHRQIYQTETMVVTATRTRRDVEEVGIPITVVSGDEIRSSGSMRLSDVLSEQTGMQIVNDHGTGIQVQGFNPDYTKIMIDGNPVIGRTAGTLDLTRISVNNVQQVEIVKGPSSALWGSDALAGVINVITEKSTDRVSGGFSTRYGEHSTIDLNADLTYNTDQWSNSLYINRNSSGGYSLNPGSVSQTVPDYTNYTGSYRTALQLTDHLEFETYARYFRETQENRSSVEDEQGTDRLLNSEDFREDFLATPAFSFTPVDRMNLSLSWMTSFYKTDSDLSFLDSGETYEATTFTQYYNKPELNAGYRWSSQHHSVTGAGVIFERLNAERYPGEPDFTTQFLFAQHSWTPSQQFELTGGVRYDTHSEYSSQLSPKFSTRYRVSDLIQFRASFGRGFKAPEFRQLFLDFTNSTAGYSVFGSSTVVDGLQRQMEEGNISQVLMPLENLDEIRAESSWAINAGFDLDPADRIRLRVNGFQNNVTDLIETAPVAQKNNGQSVFTYFNVDDVVTRGVEAEIRMRVSDQLNASLGYQLLDARRKIERERTVQNERGEVVQRTDVSYKPMFNRSRNSGNLKIFYETDSGWGANLRGTLRGRYGQFDRNGNQFVNSREYEDGYTVWYISAKRSISKHVTLRAGADNLLGYKNINQPYLAGRLWYGQISLKF